MLDEIILEIHKLIEYPFFPPFWAFGRWRYKTTNDLKKVLENYNKYNNTFKYYFGRFRPITKQPNFILSIAHNLTPKFLDKLHNIRKQFVPILNYGLPTEDNYKYYNLGKKTFSSIKSNYMKKDLFSYN